MASNDLLRRHLFAAVAIAGLLVGGIAGLFFPIRAASPPKSGNDTWALPTVIETKRFRDDAFATLRAARFWSAVTTPGQRAAPTVSWTLAAIITKPRQMAAISMAGSKPSILVALGAELPDGSTLVRLTRDAIWFEKDGCRRERRLYRAVTAENDACMGSGEPPSATSSADPTPPEAPERPVAVPAQSEKPLPPVESKTP